MITTYWGWLFETMICYHTQDSNLNLLALSTEDDIRRHKYTLGIVTRLCVYIAASFDYRLQLQTFHLLTCHNITVSMKQFSSANVWCLCSVHQQGWLLSSEDSNFMWWFLSTEDSNLNWLLLFTEDGLVIAVFWRLAIYLG